MRIALLFYFCLSLQAQLTPGPVWNRVGIVMIPTLAAEGFWVQEPEVHLVTSNCQIIASPCWAMLYSGVSAQQSTFLAESPVGDGRNWSKLPSGLPVITAKSEGCWVQVGSTFHVFVQTANGLQIDTYTGPDLAHLTLAQAAIITVGAAGTWNATQVNNCAVLYESGTYEILLEARGIGNPANYNCGAYTSTDGITFAAYSGNPVPDSSYSMGCSGPTMQRIGSGLYVWTQNSNVPTDLYRGSFAGGVFPSALSLGPLTKTYTRGTTSEGAGCASCQVADPSLLEYNGQVWMWYSSVQNQSPSSPLNYINLAIYNGTLAQLVLTQEGVFIPAGGMSGAAGISGGAKIQ